MQHGFTIIEIMVVIFLIGIITAMGLPRFLRSRRSPTEEFIGRLNTLIGEGVETAQQTGTVQRIFFNFDAKTVELQSATGTPKGKPMSIDPSIELDDILINKKSPFVGGATKRTVYFLINPEGISQEVVLFLIDHMARSKNPRGGNYEFYLNPFTSVFRVR